jgi:prepilin-type N-terminal cleavage/methylation domain-containing protein
MSIIKLHPDRGFTLAEVLIGIVILAVGLLAVMGLHMTSIRGKMFSNSLTQASIHGQEGMENLKSLPLYKADGVTLDDPFTGGKHNDADIGSFKREYQVVENTGYVTIQYTVSWVEKGVSHSTSMSVVKAR